MFTRYTAVEQQRKEEAKHREELAKLREIQEREELRREKMLVLGFPVARMLYSLIPSFVSAPSLNSEEQLRIRETELLREREAERMRELVELSRMHLMRSHLFYRGFLPWFQLMSYRRTQLAKAAIWYDDVLAEKIWLSWRHYVMGRREERQREWDHKVGVVTSRQSGGSEHSLLL